MHRLLCMAQNRPGNPAPCAVLYARSVEKKTNCLEKKWAAFCCEAAARAPPYRVTGKGLRCSCRYCPIRQRYDLHQQQQSCRWLLRTESCRLQLSKYPVTADSRTPQNAFITCVDPVSAPPPKRNFLSSLLSSGGAAGYCPRVHDAYSASAFSVITSISPYLLL